MLTAFRLFVQSLNDTDGWSDLEEYSEEASGMINSQIETSPNKLSRYMVIVFITNEVFEMSAKLFSHKVLTEDVFAEVRLIAWSNIS